MPRQDVRRRRRPVLRLVQTLLAALAVFAVALPSPASAHASLIATDPAEGAVVAEVPEEVTLTFNERVSLVPDGVRVFDAQGEPVDATSTARDAEIRVDLDDEVADGTLVIIWRVVSQDGHPISGSLSFSIGAPSAEVVAIPDAATTSTDAPWGLSLAAFVGYLGLLLAAGLVAFAVLFLPAHHLADKARRRLVGVTRVSAGAAIVAWLLAVPLTASYRFGGGLDALGRGSTWSALPRTEYVVSALVVGGLAVAVGLLGNGRHLGRVRWLVLVAAALAVVAPALTGHSRGVTPEALAVAADMLHLVAGSVWLGGLVALVVVLPDLSGRGTAAAEVLARFSAVAAGVLVAMTLTGVLLAWRIVGSWSALFGTGYGRLLLVKVGCAGVVVAIAAVNRWVLLPRLEASSHRRERRAGSQLLARTAAAEAGVLVGVLLLTGFLVDQSPEADVEVVAAAPASPVTRTAALGDLEVRATMDPPTPGSTTVTVEVLDEAGVPTEGMEAPRISVDSEELALDLGTVPAESMAPGTYAADVVLPAAGTWRVWVSLRLGEFENPVALVEFPVGTPGG